MNRILRYIKPYLFYVILSLLLAFITTVSKLYLPILVGGAIDCMVTDMVDFDRLISLCQSMAFTIVLACLCQWLNNRLNNKITYGICQDIRNEAFEKLMVLPFRYLDSHPIGETTNKIINDVDTFSDGLLLGFTNFFSSVLTILGTILFMARINLSITVVVLLLTPLSLLAARFVTKNTYNLFVLQSKTKAQQASYIDEMITNQKVVVAFHQQQSIQQAFDEINEKLCQTSTKATFFSSLTNPSTRFVNALVYAAIALFGAFSVINQTLSVGSLSSFLSYATQYSKPFNEISDVFVELQNALACGNRVFDLIDEASESSDQQAETIETLDGDVAFNDVVFSYQPNKPIINHLSFTAYRGHKIAIVGSTGCGKTTLINLLMRFYDTDCGSIQIDGKNIEQIKRSSIRHNFGMVLQDSWLKQATVKENLRFSKKDATDQEIIEACKKCHIHNFIMRLPQGYDTFLSEKNGNISAGQKQLLCIARIMIANPNIIVLDEATSAIDTRTEVKVQQAFDQLTANKTSFIVAHRLSTIQNADVIIVMDQGRIVETGNHKQLLAKKGLYYQLYHSQFNH